MSNMWPSLLWSLSTARNLKIGTRWWTICPRLLGEESGAAKAEGCRYSEQNLNAFFCVITHVSVEGDGMADFHTLQGSLSALSAYYSKNDFTLPRT